MQLTVLRLAPLFGVHALICLFHLNARPTFAWWTNQRISPAPTTTTQPTQTPPWIQKVQTTTAKSPSDNLESRVK
ncbi:hypothetical protein IQ266_00660 [filamentous cyanobacterium LEGE 11480]|uniref:Uncharacterized protein n=1 Tax=Romeriopsis navalis LEGE 11480 TaxID=2777977 RepID=A0A928Z2C8_9CYAN|nr:hypothetical protein [Romeriopsis navalis]MBE9028265.1 hypothetical protein [Romeriopsis navalis LEGE 11480]